MTELMCVLPAQQIAVAVAAATPSEPIEEGDEHLHADAGLVRAAHGMVTLELAQRFPPDADLDTAWTTGISRLAGPTSTDQT